MLLTGEVGTGKTTICRRLVQELPGNVDVALIYNPRLTARELLETLCQEFCIDPGRVEAADDLAQLLRDHMAAARLAGRNSLLIIDEAQSLDTDVLEALCHLVNTAAGRRAGLRLLLIGQPELNELLDQPQNRRFNETIHMRLHLGPLAPSDMTGYVQHRLEVAGGKRQLFPQRLMPRLHRMSEGIPRVVNLICDRALLGAFVLGKDSVTGRILEEACVEATGRTGSSLRSPWRSPAAMAGMCAVAAGVCLAVILRTSFDEDVGVIPPASAQSLSTSTEIADPADWPDGIAGTESEALAFAAVRKHWNDIGTDSPCQGRTKTGLQCIRGKDDFEDLRRLNLPAVLQLKDRHGRKTHVALVRIDSGKAVLQLGHSVRRVPVPVLVSQWTGQYTLLWRPPPDVGHGVEAGSAGPAVDWIRQRLARLNGLDASTLPQRLEGALRKHLEAFQTLEGLRATGTGDLRTLVHLASRTEDGAPVLEIRGCRP